jgi:predicted MFS family arabinose efflux permease
MQHLSLHPGQRQKFWVLVILAAIALLLFWIWTLPLNFRGSIQSPVDQSLANPIDQAFHTTLNQVNQTTNSNQQPQ